MSKKPVPFPDLDADSGDSLDRILNLNDGIFAFSMTLLAVDVNLPSLTRGVDPAQATAQIQELAPQFFIFATTFLLVALYWQVNRRTFRYIARYDARLIWINIIQLLFVAFLPVASGLFDTYTSVPIVIVIYSGTLLAIGLSGQLLWLYATGSANLANDTLTLLVRDYYSFRGYVTITIYLVMLVIGVVAPAQARWVLLALLFVYPFLKYVFQFWWQRRHPQEDV